MSRNDDQTTLPVKLGRVLLVGAGPGAVDLITVRGARVLGEAEVVIYDELANAELLELCAVEAEKIFVGKRAGCHSASQEKICGLMLEKAREGRRVVRLKGGDPMVFGRVGEELRALADAGIEFEIVPGVTAASAAGAMAGIPLTQRGVSSATVFVTGHPCTDRSAAAVDWRALAGIGATICIYMGTRQFGAIAGELIAGGLPGETPVAVVAGATLSSQTLKFGTLADGDALTNDPARRPGMIIVGEVVRWSELAGAAREFAGVGTDRVFRSE